MQIKRLNKRAILPTKKLGNAGFDIAVQVPMNVANFIGFSGNPNGYRLYPNEFKTFHTGYAIWLQDPRLELQIRSRSKLGTQKGIVITHGVGTIDSNYQGEVMVSLHNISDEPFVIEDGMFVAQGVISFIPIISSESTEFVGKIELYSPISLPHWFEEVAEFSYATDRGERGINCNELRV